jgi:hypothetical protein
VPTLFLAAPHWTDAEAFPWTCMRGEEARPLLTTEECAACARFEPARARPLGGHPEWLDFSKQHSSPRVKPDAPHTGRIASDLRSAGVGVDVIDLDRPRQVNWADYVAACVCPRSIWENTSRARWSLRGSIDRT